MDAIKPQPGPQEAFLSSPADIAIYGGAAGGGKTWALLLECLRHTANPGFGAVVFRRTYPQIKAQGGLWDESGKLYAPLGADPNVSDLSWRFPSGARVKFAHLQHEADVYNHQGAQYPLVGFDELTHFSEAQFLYLLSRNRTTCGVRPYVRATTNPDAGSWVAPFIGWWLDESGFAAPGRAGRLRWFVRDQGVIRWADAPAELADAHPGLTPKSVTFVPAKVTDNRVLTAADPGYRANLEALPYVERARLLDGNWLVSNLDGEWPADYFPPAMWFDDWPEGVGLRVIALDPSKGKGDHGDYSAYVLLARTADGTLWVEADLQRRPTPRIVADGLTLARRFPPEAFGVEANAFQELLADELARASKAAGVMLPLFKITNGTAKEVRIRRLGPYLQRGVIRFRRTPGTQVLVQQLKEFPVSEHDDGPDALEMALRLAIELYNGRRRPGGRR